MRTSGAAPPRLGLAGNVLFVGYLARDGARLLPRRRIRFVFASRTETQGLVLLEALALGVPVVSTAIMGTADVLKDAAGALIAPGDETAGFASRGRAAAGPGAARAARRGGAGRRRRMDRRGDGGGAGCTARSCGRARRPLILAPSRFNSGASVPTEWLRVMLEEVARRRAADEEARAIDKQQRRSAEVKQPKPRQKRS